MSRKGRVRLVGMGLIAVLSFGTAGCTRYPLKDPLPKAWSPPKQSGVIPFTVDYQFSGGRLPYSGEVTRYEFRDRLSELFAAAGYQPVTIRPHDPRNFSAQVHIQISEFPLGDPGAGMWTGLSLGLIPSFEHRNDLYQVNVALFAGGEELDERYFTADGDLYAGLIVYLFYFWNQDGQEVISREIVRNTLYLLEKNKTRPTLLGTLPPPEEELSPPSLDAETREYLADLTAGLRSSFIDTRIVTAKRIVLHGTVPDRDLYRLLNTLILDGYRHIDEPGHSADEIAWFCKALATSGNEDYEETLYQVYKNGDGWNLRRHARESMSLVRDYAAGGQGFNNRDYHVWPFTAAPVPAAEQDDYRD